MVEDTTITEVHFCNKTTPNSLVVETYIEDGELFANIPNILLQDNWDICVYAYCDCYTKVEERVKVKARSKPSDYVYTETEVKEWDDLVQRIDEIEKKGVSDEVIASAVNQYLTDNPIETGATDEQVAQINRNTEDIEALNNGKLDKVSHTKGGLYAVLPNGDKPYLHDYSESAKAYTIAKRWTDGTLQVGTPTDDNHATTKKYVDTAIANIKIPEGEDVDLSDYYTKEETDTAIYNSKDAYYIDFSNVSIEEQPATTEMIEFATRFDANKNVCAHIKGNPSFGLLGWGVATVNGSARKGLSFTQSGIDPRLVNAGTEHHYYKYVVEQKSSGEWVYYLDTTYTFVISTKEYVDNAIAEVSVGDLSIVLTDDGEGNVSFVGSTLTDGEEVQY